VPGEKRRRKTKKPKAPAVVEVGADAVLAGAGEAVKIGAVALAVGHPTIALLASVVAVVGTTALRGFAKNRVGSLHAAVQNRIGLATAAQFPQLLGGGVTKKRARKILTEENAKIDSDPLRREQADEIIRRLLDLPSEAGAVALGNLARLAPEHGEDGATSTFKAIARLLSILSAQELADLRRTIRIAMVGRKTILQERPVRSPFADVLLRTTEDHHDLATPAKVAAWRVRCARPYAGETEEQEVLQGEGDQLFQAIRNAGVGGEALGHVEPMPHETTQQVSISIRLGTIRLLADVLGPDTARKASDVPT
jgi:hypothetical protein